tara:strand:- start:13 stop:258 length:246 start_codon:yes stop_codon:yes gene_type:complete
MKEANIGEIKVTYSEELVFLKFNGVEEELILKADTIKKLNDLVNDFSKQIVSKCCDICDAELKHPPQYYDCDSCSEIVRAK